MKCPYCKSEQIKVTGRYIKNSPLLNNEIKYRYRKCLDCGKSFRSIEEYSAETLKEVEEWKTNCSTKCINSIRPTRISRTI